MRQLTVSSEEQKVKHETAVDSICFTKETISQLEESLARYWEELRRCQQECNVALAEGEKLQSSRREVEAQFQSNRAILEPLERELSTLLSPTDEDWQALPQKEVERLQHERLKIQEGLSRLDCDD